MKNIINFDLLKALVHELSKVTQPVVTPYQIGKLIFNVSISHLQHDEKSGFRKNSLDEKQYIHALDLLLSTGVITKVSSLSGGFFKILGKPDATPDEIICSIDPFCYISHLSAMEYHGITDRLPRTIFVTSPPSANWKKYAELEMKKELKGQYISYIESHFPTLSRHHPQKIAGKIIEYKNDSHMGAYKMVQGQSLRVATLGRTFLDMLRNPELCGGMQHVIDVYKDYSLPYLRLIIDEIDTHGKDIEKMRAGYILEEQVKVTNNLRIAKWREKIQRGGSRKLDPKNEFSSYFSERWSLSLNLPSVNSNAD